MIRIHLMIFIMASSISSSVVKADDCLDWFVESKLRASSVNCSPSCKVLKVDMSTFTCHDRCDEFCKPVKCEHNKFWQSKIKSGRPHDWETKSEKSIEWSEAEKEVISTFLDRLPEQIKSIKLTGIFRLKKSVQIINPGTSSEGSIALYDRAFSNPFWKTEEVLAHEFGHIVFSDLKEIDQRSYRSAMKWTRSVDLGFSRPGPFASSRAEDGIDEDFAENFNFFLNHPEDLKVRVPAAYTWMVTRFGRGFILKKRCKNES